MVESVAGSDAPALDADSHRWMPSAWNAAGLSIVAPGLGQLYNGRLYRAIASLIIVCIWFPLGMTAVVAAPTRALRIALTSVVILVPLVAFPWDAARTALRTRAMKRRWFQRWYALLAALALWGFGVQPEIADGVKRHLTEAFRIPTGAMVPTILMGDYLLVSKWDRRHPERGQVVVFADARGRHFVQRIAGVGGDTLAMRAYTLIVNGQAFPEPYAHNDGSVDPADKQFQWQRRSLVDPKDSVTYQPTAANWGPLLVPPDHYFLLGDNRGSSYDSRYTGFVAEHQLRGRPRWVYFSRDPNSGDVRWSRIGVGIR